VNAAAAIRIFGTLALPDLTRNPMIMTTIRTNEIAAEVATKMSLLGERETEAAVEILIGRTRSVFYPIYFALHPLMLILF